MTVSTTCRANPSATEPSARLRDLLAAEWIKLWSLRSTWWALAISALGIIAANVDAAIADYNNFPTYSSRVQSDFISSALFDAFTNVASQILMLAAGSIGAIMIVSEYSTGLVRTTFAAVPARQSVMAAKAAILSTVMLGYGLVIAAISFGATQTILSERNAGVSIAHPAALRVIVASAVFAPVCALVGLGIGALVRHSATSMVATVVVLMLLPFFFTDKYRWSADVLNGLPHSAWYRLSAEQFAHMPRGLSMPGAWFVLAAWAVVAVVVAVVVVDRRDV
jgi:hypothetical protein